MLFGKDEPRDVVSLKVKITFNSELCTLRAPLYSMKPSLRNLFMKALTRDRVVPIISARVSWLIFAMICGPLSSGLGQLWPSCFSISDKKLC